MNAWLKTATEKMTWSINTMLPTKTTAKGSVPSALANLPPDYAQYAPGVPPGVPKHDMVNCQMAIVEMGKQGKPLLVDAPENKRELSFPFCHQVVGNSLTDSFPHRPTRR